MSRHLFVRAETSMLLAVLVMLVCPLARATDSKDGYVLRKGNTWTLGTGKVERTITFAHGLFFTSSFKDKTSAGELLPSGTFSEEIGVADGENGPSHLGALRLVSARDGILASGEIKLEIGLRHGDLQVTKTYVVYPGTSIIREWVQFKNVGKKAFRVREPRFLNFVTNIGLPESQK